jgi:hypothetical protein
MLRLCILWLMGLVVVPTASEGVAQKRTITLLVEGLLNEENSRNRR